MNPKPEYLVCGLVIVAVAVMAGCVAPPTESLSTTTYTYNPDQFTTATTSTDALVTEVTPYINPQASGVTTTESLGYHTFATPTPLPEDKSCRIYTKTQTFTYNGSAFTFNLKNPPMYINYSVTPTNITVRKATTSEFKDKPEVVITYSTYDPQSYLEITVRNRTTGEIYLQDGFGKDYSTYMTRTLKVLNTDDLLIELKGNKMTATVNFWVKPDGNFEDPANMTFDTCTYWGQSTRDSTALAFVSATPTPTWTY